MAVINSEDSYIFLHIYKTGGTTMQNLLGESPDKSIGGHANLADLKDHYISKNSKEDWDKMFKFTFVREPLDWLLSHFKHIKRNGGHNFHPRMKDETFEGFIDWYINEAYHFDRPKGSNKFLTLEYFCRDRDGVVDLDHIARFENFEDECKYILNRLGKEVPDEIPMKNAAAEQEVEVSESAKDKVREFFGGDYRLFNYRRS